MKRPSTLLELSGVTGKTELDRSQLVLIDFQNEYRAGALPLFEIEGAIAEARKVLDLARAKGIPVVHVVHRGSRGGIFDLQGEGGAIIDELQPVRGEVVVEKGLPNSFAGTDLDEILRRNPDRKQLILVGAMTHMCVQTTATSAVDRGYFTTVVASATTTRDLRGPNDETIPAATIKASALALLKDRFAWITPTAASL